MNNFSTIAKPLTNLTGKNLLWSWGLPEKKAFKCLKLEMSKEPVLIHPNPTLLYTLETDASGVAMGAILSQRGKDGYLHPIAHMSQSHHTAQRSHDSHDKELLAIITAFEHQCLLLELTKEPITIYTDHHNLEYWKNAQEFNRQHARWYQFIVSFNFNIIYHSRKMSVKPDALSR